MIVAVVPISLVSGGVDFVVLVAVVCGALCSVVYVFCCSGAFALSFRLFGLVWCRFWLQVWILCKFGAAADFEVAAV